jgi:LTXXQ motif family protein
VAIGDFLQGSPAIGDRVMKSISKLLAAALVIAAAMTGVARSEDQPAQQSAPNPGDMMGYGFSSPGMMGPGMMGYDGGSPGTMHGAAFGPAMCTAMAGHVEGRLAYVKTELKITAAQESLWNTYAAAARDGTSAMLARCTVMMTRRGGSTASLPDRLDQNEQFMAAQLDSMRAMNKALKPLYAALSENQRQTADQLFWGPMGMM